MLFFCSPTFSFLNFLDYHSLKRSYVRSLAIRSFILSIKIRIIFCSFDSLPLHFFPMQLINRYHNTRMVNYDAHNGFSVSSTLLQPMDELQQQPQQQQPHHEIQMAGSNAKQQPPNATATNKNAPLSKTKKPSYSQTPSISILTISEVSLKHAGNITCAPSNAKQASITVHVLRGNINVHRKAIKHIFIAHSLLFSSSFFLIFVRPPRSHSFIRFCSSACAGVHVRHPKPHARTVFISLSVAYTSALSPADYPCLTLAFTHKRKKPTFKLKSYRHFNICAYVCAVLVWSPECV